MESKTGLLEEIESHLATIQPGAMEPGRREKLRNAIFRLADLVSEPEPMEAPPEQPEAPDKTEGNDGGGVETGSPA